MRILVLGRSGQLAQELARFGDGGEGVETICIGRDTLDLSSPSGLGSALDSAISRAQPDAVVNASAYTAVDKAESDNAGAFALNRDAPGAIAQACLSHGVPLVHVSTDYVFDGRKPDPYVETDPRTPLGVYGHSKSEGEDRILSSGAMASILRTSWVYSATGSNFVKTMLRLAETRDEVGVVADQAGRPTWARDLAEACLASARAMAVGQADAAGVFHYAGAGDAVWADVAEAVFAGAVLRGAPSARVKRITTAEYPTPARRPANSRLDTSLIERTLNIRARPWREGVDLCLDQLLGPVT